MWLLSGIHLLLFEIISNSIACTGREIVYYFMLDPGLFYDVEPCVEGDWTRVFSYSKGIDHASKFAEPFLVYIYF